VCVRHSFEEGGEHVREPFVPVKRAGLPDTLHYSEWPGVRVGFSLRTGGVSQTPFASLNVALHVHDAPADVIQNRQLLAAAEQLPFAAWTCAEQVHGTEVRVVSAADGRGAGRLERADAIAAVDGLVTNESELWLTSFYADCVPLYFYDPQHQVLALSHAGWRGTVGHIARVTLQTMADRFGSEPAEVRALIGPAIGACCYEVDGPVVDAVRTVCAALNDVESSHASGRPTDAFAEVFRPTDSIAKKGVLDLKLLNQKIMMKAGVLPQHIEISQYCTCCRTDLFFSHRGEHGNTGRMVAWLYRTAEETR
jgi:YfiH family protein